jgi:hypothetical protein
LKNGFIFSKCAISVELVGISEETYATGRPAHPLFDSMPFAAIHRTIDNLEMRDFTKHFPHHLACIIRRAIQRNQNLVRETRGGEIFIKSL